MKLISLILVFFTASLFANFPENDLWKEDRLGFRGANVDETMFNDIITLGYEFYEPYAMARGESLTINRKWEDPTVNANCSRWGGKVTVNMFGGLARRPEITPEGFALVLCHELGHAYGGTPYIQTWTQMSAEGQADYYGAKECHAKIMSKLGLNDFSSATEFINATCGTNESCLLGLLAGQSLGTLLATMKNVPAPDYETPDPTVVTKTELSYPKTVQCRLDTYFRGTTKGTRPSCWFKN